MKPTPPQQFGEQLDFRCVVHPVPMSRAGAWMVGYTDDLTDRFVLVIEDESIAVIDIGSIISMAGGRVIGPFQSVGQGFGFRRFKHIDAALLDINLNGELVCTLADAIAERGIPIVFISAHSLAIAAANFAAL